MLRSIASSLKRNSPREDISQLRLPALEISKRELITLADITEVLRAHHRTPSSLAAGAELGLIRSSELSPTEKISDLGFRVFLIEHSGNKRKVEGIIALPLGDGSGDCTVGQMRDGFISGSAHPSFARYDRIVDHPAQRVSLVYVPLCKKS